MIGCGPVDGYEPSTKVVFQYHGCHWHGCRRCFLRSREKIVTHGQRREALYIATTEHMAELRCAGYRVVVKWECSDKKMKEPLPAKETKSYPHAIFYDFESWHNKTKRKKVTPTLTYEAAHIPISVSVGDMLEHQPMHICDPRPKELIRRLMKELERRGQNIH